MTTLASAFPELNVRMDASNRFFEKQLEAIDSDVERRELPEIKYKKYIPVVEGFSPGAATTLYRMITQHGSADLITDKSQKIPLVGMSGDESSQRVLPVADGYVLSRMELLAAEKAGVALDREHAYTAHEAIERRIDGIAALGDNRLGVEGFCNNSNVPALTAALNAAAASRLWEAKTPEEILADLNLLVQTIIDGTAEIEEPDTLLMPSTLYVIIASRKMTDTDKTILQWFLAANPWIKNIGTWHYLKTAGAGSTRRIVAYKRDPGKLKYKNPCGLITLPAQYQELNVNVYMFKTTSGLELRRPKSMAYMDGA